MFNSTRREAAHSDARPDPRVASLLEAAAAPSEPGPLPGEAEALAAFVASRATPTRRPPVLSTLMTARMATAAAVSGVLLTGGVGAAAAAGSLPGAAQDTASQWLSKVGVTVPGAAARSAGHADERGDGDEAVAGDGAAEDDRQGKGEAASGVARDDTTSGRDKGAAVSELASDGRSRAGEHEGADAHGGHATPEERGGETGMDTATQRSANAGNRDHADKAEKADGVEPAEDVRSEDPATSGAEETDGADGGRPAAGSGERP